MLGSRTGNSCAVKPGTNIRITVSWPREANGQTAKKIERKRGEQANTSDIKPWSASKSKFPASAPFYWVFVFCVAKPNVPWCIAASFQLKQRWFGHSRGGNLRPR